MAGPVLTPGQAMGASAALGGMDIMAGLFGFMAGQEGQALMESRARMLQMEADADATRYAEDARAFKGSQKLAFLKSGVQLTGSPLDILDETSRVAAENISAMRAAGRARAADANFEGAKAAMAGRNALIGGISSAARGSLNTWAQVGRP